MLTTTSPTTCHQFCFYAERCYYHDALLLLTATATATAASYHYYFCDQHSYHDSHGKQIVAAEVESL